MNKPSFLSSRKFRQGSMATAITVVVVALVVVVNFVATALTQKYSWSLDLTPNKVFSITSETRQYLSDLDKDVAIFVLDTEESYGGKGEYYLQAIEVLKKYALESPRISLEYVDLMANPTFAQQYPELQLSSQSILITSGGKVRDVVPYDLYDIQSNEFGQGVPVASKAEQVLTSALLTVTSDNTTNVAVLTGHNEENTVPLTTLLQTNNYMIESVSTLTTPIGPEFAVAIIAAPTQDYSEDELRQLDTFLKNGGQYGKTLLYFPSGEQTELPNLAAFLADWGITVHPGMVFETDPNRYLPQDPFVALVDYSEGEYSQSVQAKGMPFLAPYARPLELLFESKSSVSTSTLLHFAPSVGIASSPTEIIENAGPMPFLVMSQNLTYEGTTPLQSQVVVAASSGIAYQELLSNPAMANSEYLLNLLSTLSGKEDAVQIQSKDLGSATLGINDLQALALGVVLTVLFPLALLIFGLVVWARRRHR